MANWLYKKIDHQSEDLSGVQKASVLLMALGASTSADVFKYLTDQEIEIVAAEIERMPQVDSALRLAVVAEFQDACQVVRQDGLASQTLDPEGVND